MVDGQILPGAAWRSTRAATLLKLLALAPKHRLHREQLMDALWPDAPSARAANSLHQTLHIARRILAGPQSSETHLLCLSGEIVSLAPDSDVWVDVDAFEAAVRSGDGDAASLYTGELLPEDLYQEWTLERRSALCSMYLQLKAEQAREAELRGDLAEAIRCYQEVVQLDALREDAHLQLMRLYASLGHRHDALRQYEILERVLRDELGVEPDPAGTRLYSDILKGVFPQVPVLEPSVVKSAPEPLPSSGNLPQYVNRFVGRTRDVPDLARILQSARILTLTGTGGCGKTRLAIHLARDIAEQFADGAWLVELASLRNPLLVSHAVASALSVPERSDQPLSETLAAHIGHRNLLLVLDNCEHLIDAVATLAHSLVASCPGLRILTTSREPLHIPGEIVWRVSSLSVPDPTHIPDIATLQEIDAVSLFLDRAQSTLPEFRLDEANAPAIAQICYHLDGIPLALELAAARVGALSVEQILILLDDCFTLLTRGSRTSLSRQQTLKALLDWSHDLLTPEEQRLFRRLAVFAGGFSLDAAESVGGGGILNILASLVDKSLVQADRQGLQVRYRLLEPVRQYANLHLSTAGETREAYLAHARWYSALARRADAGLWSAEHQSWAGQFEREHDNLRAVLGRCVRGELEIDLGLRLVDALWQFWLLSGYLTEGRSWLDGLLARDPPASTHKANAMLHATGLALRQGDYTSRTVRLTSESLATFRDLGDTHGESRALRALGSQAYVHGEYSEAESYFHQCAHLAVLSGQEEERALAVHELGIIAWARGQDREAREQLDESCALFRTLDTDVDLPPPFLNVPLAEAPYGGLGDVLTIQEETWIMLRRLSPPVAAALTLSHLATLARTAGALDDAGRLVEDSVDACRQYGDMAALAQALAQLGNLYRAMREYNTARDALYESLDLRRSLGDRRGVGRSLNNLGILALYAGNARRASAFFEESMDLFGAMNDRPGIAATYENQGHLALFEKRWDEARRAYGRSVALSGEVGGVKRWRATNLRHIGLAALGAGDVDQALSAFGQSRALFLEMNDTRSARVAEGLGRAVQPSKSGIRLA